MIGLPGNSQRTTKIAGLAPPTPHSRSLNIYGIVTMIGRDVAIEFDSVVSAPPAAATATLLAELRHKNESVVATRVRGRHTDDVAGLVVRSRDVGPRHGREAV